jgi:multiple sugar transport system substrate-binding protein
MQLGIGGLALGATGCSVTGAPTNTSTATATGGAISGTVNVLLMKQAGWTEADWAGVIKKFEAANPGVTVTPTFVAYEALHDKIVSSAAAGTYDMILIDVIWPAEFVEKKMIVDVTNRIPPAWKTGMQGGALQAAIYKDHFYAAPAFPSTKLFYYNKSLMSKAGIAEEDITSWTGVMAAAKQMMQKGVCQHPLAWSWSQAEAVVCDFAQLLGAFGGTFTDSSGKLIFNNEAGIKTLQFMVDTLKDGTSAPGSTTFLEDDVSKAMQSGDIAFSLNWESTFRDLNDASTSKAAGKCGVSATPMGPSGKRPGVNGAMAYSLTTGSKNPEAAWKLIEFATSAAVQNPLAKSAMPDWTASYSDPEVVKVNPQVFEACKVAYADSILRPQVANYNKVSTILQVEIQNALLGKKPVSAALNDAVNQGNQSLK